MKVELAEMAGNLKAELLNVQEDMRVRSITPQEALRRIGIIRARRQAGQREAEMAARPPQEPMLFAAVQG